MKCLNCRSDQLRLLTTEVNFDGDYKLYRCLCCQGKGRVRLETGDTGNEQGNALIPIKVRGYGRGHDGKVPRWASSR